MVTAGVGDGFGDPPGTVFMGTGFITAGVVAVCVGGRVVVVGAGFVVGGSVGVAAATTTTSRLAVVGAALLFSAQDRLIVPADPTRAPARARSPIPCVATG